MSTASISQIVAWVMETQNAYGFYWDAGLAGQQLEQKMTLAYSMCTTRQSAMASAIAPRRI